MLIPKGVPVDECVRRSLCGVGHELGSCLGEASSYQCYYPSVFVSIVDRQYFLKMNSSRSRWCKRCTVFTLASVAAGTILAEVGGFLRVRESAPSVEWKGKPLVKFPGVQIGKIARNSPPGE